MIEVTDLASEWEREHDRVVDLRKLETIGYRRYLQGVLPWVEYDAVRTDLRRAELDEDEAYWRVVIDRDPELRQELEQERRRNEVREFAHATAGRAEWA